MKTIIVNSYDEASAVGAAILAQQIWDKPNSILGLATGGTPVGLYARLVAMHKGGMLDFSQVTSFNLDEYYQLPKSNDQSYDYFMRENLFDHVNIKDFFLPDGMTKDVPAECAAYDAKITAAGGIDMQLLGIGVNGHIGFNEPAAILPAGTHLTNLAQATIDVNARFFNGDASKVPTQAITMGMGSIMAAKKILLLACGKSKAPIMKELCAGKLTADNPSSLLALHPDCTIVVDKEALGA
ncbi:MAG: glucosamine-6-phosphate deaminase [Oscillospiraceae bacterium]|nr:glucosamine-6-phosphate deaminase [Oscillospiraceae bacterium]